MPREIPVACGGVDNSCMALGARNTAEGRLYASLGSSMWIAVSSRKPLLDDTVKPYVFTHVIPGMFTSAVAIFSGGSSLKWVKDQLCVNLPFQARITDRDPYELMMETAGQSPVGAKNLLFNPSLGGGSSLEPSPNIRGAFLGLDLEHTQPDVIRAVLEGIALNLRLALDELRRLEDIADEMVVVGGASRSDLWRQIFADAFEIDILKTNIGQEAGSLGAAAVAAVGSGLWDDFSPIDTIHRRESLTRPNPENVSVYKKAPANLPRIARVSGPAERDGQVGPGCRTGPEQRTIPFPAHPQETPQFAERGRQTTTEDTEDTEKGSENRTSTKDFPPFIHPSSLILHPFFLPQCQNPQPPSYR